MATQTQPNRFRVNSKTDAGWSREYFPSRKLANKRIAEFRLAGVSHIELVSEPFASVNVEIYWDLLPSGKYSKTDLS